MGNCRHGLWDGPFAAKQRQIDFAQPNRAHAAKTHPCLFQPVAKIAAQSVQFSMTLTVANRTFDAEVNYYSNEIRPNEGDVIYFPLNRKMFEVQHVEHEAIFYQMGALQTYDLRVELFEYSGERFNTGIDEIDTRFDAYVPTAPGAIANVETVSAFADNSTIEQEATTGGVYSAEDILDFSETNPFGENEY